jgi:hypothetical protein
LTVKHPIEQIILDSLNGRTSIDQGLIYEEAYHITCQEAGTIVSHRDFRKALDRLQHDGLIEVKEDPRDRRRKRIFQAAREPDELKLNYNLALAWRLEKFLTDVFKKEPWLTPIKIPISPDLDPWGKTGPTVRELVQKFPWWQTFTEEEAKDVISIERATWRPIFKKYAGQQRVLEKKLQEYTDVMIAVNVEEIIDAWNGKRAVDRLRILKTMRQRLALIATKS